MKKSEKTLIGILIVLLFIYGLDVYISKSKSNKSYTAFIDQGEKYLLEEKYNEAAEAFSNALLFKDNHDIRTKHTYSISMIQSKNAFQLGMRRLEENEYRLALGDFKRVNSLDKGNYPIALEKIAEIQLILAGYYLMEAKDLFNEKEFIDAFNRLEIALHFNPDLDEALELIDQYREKKEKEEEKITEELRKIQEKKQAEAIEKAKTEAIENMRLFERGQGPIGIAAKVEISEKLGGYYSPDGKSWFVQIYISAKNFGDSSIAVNGRHFTLSTVDGYTVNPHKVTYTANNYFDSIQLLPGNYSGGWLVFYMPKEDEYILNYNSNISTVFKRVIAY